MATKAASKPSAKTTSKSAQAQAKGQTNANDPLHSTASKDIWLAGLGAMAQAQAQARAQGSKAFESLNVVELSCAPPENVSEPNVGSMAT